MLHHVFSCLLRAKVTAQKELSSRSCFFDVPILLLPFSSCIFCNRAAPLHSIFSLLLVWNYANMLYCISREFSDCCSKSQKFSWQWLGLSFLWGRRWLCSLTEGCSIRGCFTRLHSARNTEVFEKAFLEVTSRLEQGAWDISQESSVLQN